MNKKKILIIDDDPNNIFALSAVLKAKGFTVAGKTNMNDAFVLLKEDSAFGIILMDMMMPGMDGYQAIPTLRSQKGYGHIPVLAVTAQAMTGDREKCIEAGADDYLSKPVDIDKLMMMLNQYMK